MGDKWWPRTIKPLTSKNYSTSRGGNIAESNVAGGLPRIGLDQTLESPLFNLNFILSDNAYRALLNFYDAGINHGANSFKMMLDSGTGIVEHQCTIKANTFKSTRPSHGTWYVAVSVYAHVTPSQLDTCDNFYQLYDCYGEQVSEILNSLESFVKGIPIE